MASFASSATTCGARKHAWTNIKLYVCLIFSVTKLNMSCKVVVGGWFWLILN